MAKVRLVAKSISINHVSTLQSSSIAYFAKLGTTSKTLNALVYSAALNDGLVCRSFDDRAVRTRQPAGAVAGC